MPKVTIDEKVVDVPEGTNLIEAARLGGIEVPHYCYHPKLSVAGNCRMCLVEIEKQPKLQIACNTKVAEGMVVKTQNPRVEKARRSVLEFILINHPIDCPICDQAGECKLQEYYMKHDLAVSRFPIEEKVHKDKAVDLGPWVMLDMERCILCTRCVRFCQEVAEVNELCVSERGDHSTLTTFPGAKLENPYSANVVEICPVGALTNKDFRFKCRVWFLKRTESVCPGCSMGCNINIDQNEGEIHRLTPRVNEEVNEHWMCDEGRLTYKPVNQKNRLRFAKMGEKDLHPDEVLRAVREMMTGVDPNLVCGIGSAQFTNEDNYALASFLKELGSSHLFYHRFEPAHPSVDDYLIKADKNPNTKGVSTLGFKEIGGDRRFKFFFVLGALPEEALNRIALEQQKKVILFNPWDEETVHYADTLLPVGTFAETEGTFTNCQGRVQRIRAAFPPPGEGRPVWQWLTHLTRLFEKPAPNYTTAPALFLSMANQIAAFRGLDYEKIGNQGMLLKG
ncbi:MAG: 2Fe-2S iron-sulfur cluster-binding protein [Deltaproteobacteria bacterium]|nr:2Fe-2S iron-sulfur cluster-binding protein [Deltaproteobacteria bacterium]